MDVVIEERAVSTLEQVRRDGLPVLLPQEYVEFAVFVESLRTSGVLVELEHHVLQRRAGAYELVDLVLFLVAFFAAGSKAGSLADFAASSAAYGNELASIGGRARWMTQASVSRALAAVGDDTARHIAQRLLTMSRGTVLNAELCDAVGYRDGAGVPWRVLHWDTKVDPVRHRALPEGGDLPPGIRVSTDLCAPGYGGRKRGEVMFARSIVSDATTSLWVHMDLNSGSGSTTEQVRRAVADVTQYLGHCPAELERTVLVCDGVSGGWPQTHATLEAGLHIVTRIADYDWLATKAHIARIARGPWHPVEDSRSGPRRDALELCQRRVGDRDVRVVASRFPVRGPGQGRGAGRTIDGWHYELFVSSLPRSGWAANDLVTLYYGRTAIENRFAAEDREYALSRVFSYTKPGQLLASSVALALWNHGVVTGLASVSHQPPERPSRPRQANDTTLEQTEPGRTEPDDPKLDVGSPTAESGEDESVPEHHVPTGASQQDEQALARAVATRWCEHRPGWSYDDPNLRCPAGEKLTPTWRKHAEHEENDTVRFRAPVAACRACERRTGCASSPSPRFRKEISLRIRLLPRQTPPARVIVVALLAAPSEKPLPPHLPDAPTLLPASLRKQARHLYRTALVTVRAPPLVRPLDELLDAEHRDMPLPMAETAEARQRRRKLIAERVAANARLPDEKPTIRITVSAAQATHLRRLQDGFRSA